MIDHRFLACRACRAYLRHLPELPSYCKEDENSNDGTGFRGTK